MNDLQLLELLERAQKKQRGEKGQPGVGIESVEQFDDQSFTLRLSDGSFKKITIPAPVKGEVGEVGPTGPKGDVGPSGKDGRNGADALPGRDGLPGPVGTSIDTAVVNSSGHLLVGLTDGQVLDVGRVVGPAGATGASGPTGLPGADGKDGAAVLSGPRAPQQDDGKEGDFWIDISSAEFGFYKKSGNGWSLLANLRQPAKDLRLGAGGSGSGSGSDGTKTGTTYGPTFPSNPKAGAQHVMSDTLYEYVYTGGEWMQIVGSGGGGESATTLGALADVNLSGTQKGDVIIATNNSTWENSHVLDGGTY